MAKQDIPGARFRSINIVWFKLGWRPTDRDMFAKGIYDNLKHNAPSHPTNLDYKAGWAMAKKWRVQKWKSYMLLFKALYEYGKPATISELARYMWEEYYKFYPGRIKNYHFRKVEGLTRMEKNDILYRDENNRYFYKQLDNEEE